jgi:hypothetical protein
MGQTQPPTILQWISTTKVFWSTNGPTQCQAKLKCIGHSMSWWGEKKRKEWRERESEREKLVGWSSSIIIHISINSWSSFIIVHFSLIIGRYLGRCLRREKIQEHRWSIDEWTSMYFFQFCGCWKIGMFFPKTKAKLV